MPALVAVRELAWAWVRAAGRARARGRGSTVGLSEDHGSGRLLHAGSHHTAGSLLMPVRITSKDTVTFATGGGLTTNKDPRAKIGCPPTTD